MKNILGLITAAVVSFGIVTTASAETVNTVGIVTSIEKVTVDKVKHVARTVTSMVPTTKREAYTVLEEVRVPVAGQSDPGAVLFGAILGGVLGKEITDNDGGAAVGAIIGGAIANDSTSTGGGYRIETREVTRYRDVTVMKEVTRTVYDKVNVAVFSHFDITIDVAGMDMSFTTKRDKYSVGDEVKVRLNVTLAKVN